MRVLGFFIVLSLVIAGYASAAKAFGLIQSCDPSKMAAHGMMDCCNHDGKKPVPANCLKCDCCMATVVMPAIAVASYQADIPAKAAPHAATPDGVIAKLLYPPLRPPNALV